MKNTYVKKQHITDKEWPEVPLTEEQKSLASSHYKLALFFVDRLQRKKEIELWEKNDVLGHIHWTLCNCAARYNPNRIGPHGKKAAFTTLAVKSFYRSFANYKCYEQKHRERFAPVHFSLSGEDTDEHQELVCEEPRAFLEWQHIKFIFEKIEMNELEYQIVHLRLGRGYTLERTGKIVKRSTERVRQVLYKIIRIVQMLIAVEGYELEDFLVTR